MTTLLFILSLFSAGLAVLPFHVFNLRAGWLASVIVTEYGHWLAPAALIGLAFAATLSTTGRRTVGTVTLLAFAGSAVVFARPAVLAFAEFGGWQRQLRRAFGGTLDESGFVTPDLLRLWFGPPLATVIKPRTFTYVTRADEALALDVYPPDQDRPAPWVLVIHGGGWDSGDRTQMPELNSYLAARGIGAVSVDYRLAPRHPWPAARDDVRAAVDFVKAHARELNLDPSRWVILGRSAGGQLAEIVAFTANDRTLRGCVSLYAPTDMVKAYEWGREDDILKSRELVRRYMGEKPGAAPRAYADASPLDHVGVEAPPTLQLHGSADPLVWVRHAERLRDRLTEAGVANALITVPWGTHGFDYNLWGPGGQTLTTTLDAFLRRVF